MIIIIVTAQGIYLANMLPRTQPISSNCVYLVSHLPTSLISSPQLRPVSITHSSKRIKLCFDDSTISPRASFGYFIQRKPNVKSSCRERKAKEVKRFPKIPTLGYSNIKDCCIRLHAYVKRAGSPSAEHRRYLLRRKKGRIHV